MVEAVSGKDGSVGKRTVAGSYSYEPADIRKGYTDRVLCVDISDNTFREQKVSRQMKKLFVGGKGYGVKLLWDAVKPETKWSDPENAFIVSPGPVCGTTQYPGCGKSIVVTLSPLTGTVIDSNVGGFFGPFLKCSGWDALQIQGKSDRDVILFIDGDKQLVQVVEDYLDETDSHLLAARLTADFSENEADMPNVSVISAGRGAEHSMWGMVNFSLYDRRRKDVRLKQAGRGGTGMVLRDKGVKAIVVRSSRNPADMNHAHDPARVSELGMTLHREIFGMDNDQIKMRKSGTSFLVELCNNYELLPVKNYKYGADPEHHKIKREIWEKRFTQGIPDGCWYGCTIQCAKAVDGFELKTGPYKGQKVIVDGPEYETIGALGSNCGIFDPDHILEANFYCDTYGLDTIGVGTGTAFLMECYEMGILDKGKTGGLELCFGNSQAAMELLHQIASGTGFGAVAGMGIRGMKQYFVAEYGADPGVLADIGMETKGLEYSEYVTKDCISQQAGYAMANKGPQHDETWMMGAEVINRELRTLGDKAEAVYWFSLFRTWFSLNGTCKMPWADIVPADNHLQPRASRVPGHVQSLIDLYSAVTGDPLDEEGMLRQSERVHNLQRALNVKMGVWGKEKDRPPYRAMGPVTEEEYLYRKDFYDSMIKNELGKIPETMKTPEKLAVIREYKQNAYSRLQQMIYAKRGWNEDGIPTVARLKELGIDDPSVIETVEKALAESSGRQ